MTCPFCHQELDDAEATACPHCGQSFELPELQRYSAPLELLEDALDQVQSGQIPAHEATGLFSHLMGAVQQVLDTAREELSRNLRRLKAVEDEPPEVRREALEFIEEFELAQDRVNEALESLQDVFASIETVQDFEAEKARLDHAVAVLSSALGDLEHLERQTSDPQLTLLPDEPLPEEVSYSIEQFDQAMEAMGEYCESRDRTDLEKCLRHLDEARNKIKQMLMVEAFDWS